MSSNLKLEMEAYKGLTELLEQAEKTRTLFERARIPVPETLQRLFRSNGNIQSAQQWQTVPFKPVVPSDVDPEWIWVDLKDAGVQSATLAILRDAPAPGLMVKDIKAKLSEFGIEASMGTIANVFTRAFKDGTAISDIDGHWSLLNTDKVAIIHGDYIWGSLDMFQVQEIASHRRKAIIYVLRKNPEGLLQSQILAQLERSDLLKPGIPVNKTLIKADIEAMAGKQVRKVGNSKKWEAI